MRTVVLASVLAGLLLLAAMPASAGLAGWQYQREIAIQENSGETLHDYQVLVELNGDDFPDEAQPDGDDIRFTDADGCELSYWIEEFDAGSERAKMWVEVPLIPANGEAHIMMWYSNPGATSVSDGEEVFEFFDDFDENDLDRSKWDLNKGDSHISVSDGVLTWHIVHGEHIDISTKSISVMPFAVDYRWYLNPYSSTDFYYMSVYSGDNSYSSVGYAHWSRYESAFYTGSKNVPPRTSSWASTEGHIIPNPTVSRWYKSSFIVQSESLEEIRDGTKYSTTSYVGKSGRVGIFAAISRSAAKFDYVRVRSYASPEPTVTLAPPAPAIYTTLAIAKSPSPNSIRQFQETTITLSIVNTGTTDATDIEITDAIHPSFDLVSGDFPNPKRYDLIRPGETRDIQYTISAKESGTFTLDPATVTYADGDGNIQEALSEPASIKVIPSTDGSTSSGTSRSNPSVSTASVQLHGEKTDVVLGEDILFKLSAVNLITKPTMHVQVIIIPPSGMSVTSSAFAKSGAGQYTTTYELEPGTGKDIEVAIRSNQVGDFNVNGRIIYYFGDDREHAEDHTLNLPITVRAEPDDEQTESSSESKEASAPGFVAVVAVIGLLAAHLRRRI